MKRWQLALLLGVGICAASAASTPPAAASIQSIHQVTTIGVYVNVGVTPAPTAPPSAQAGAATSVNVNVGAPLSTAPYFVPAATTIVFNGNPGDTITQPCAEQLAINTMGAPATIDTGLDDNFVALVGSGTIPTTAFTYQIPPQTTWTTPIDFTNDGKVFAVMTSFPSTETSLCINLQYTIPSGTAPGTYYAAWQLVYYAALGT